MPAKTIPNPLSQEFANYTRRRHKTLKDNNIVWYIAIAIIPIASLAGLAASMRAGHPLTKIEIVSAMLNSGLFGFVVFCLGAHYWGTDSLFLLVGVSVLSGLGGNSAIDFARSAFRKTVAQQLGIGDDQEHEQEH